MEGSRKVSGLDEPITYSGQLSTRSAGGRSGERRQALTAASYRDLRHLLKAALFFRIVALGHPLSTFTAHAGR